MASVKQRINIKFYVHLGKSATEILEMLKHVRGSETLFRTQAFEWHCGFRKGTESDKEDEHCTVP